MSTYEEDAKQAMEAMLDIENFLRLFDMESKAKIGEAIIVKRPARFKNGEPA